MNIESTIEIAAAATHEANRVYCKSIGDDSQVQWDQSPYWQKCSAIAGVRAILRNPSITPRMQHEEWAVCKENDGWVYGETKDEVKKTHPCLVEYDRLTDDQKIKDVIFGNVARGVLRAFKLIA
jgi:hypothetical protein